MIEILKEISFDWNDIIDQVQVFSSLLNKYATVKGVDLDLGPVPSYPNCKKIDIQKHFPNLYAPTQIFINLEKIKNLGVDLYILDRHVASRRSFKSELLAYSGPTLSNPASHLV